MKITLDLPEPQYELGQIVAGMWEIVIRDCWIKHIYKESVSDAPKMKPETRFENELKMTWQYTLRHKRSGVLFGYDEISLTRELKEYNMLRQE